MKGSLPVIWGFLSIFWFEFGTSTLLSSGLMLNFGLGAYLAREFISVIFGNPMRTVSTTQITRQDGSIYNSSGQGLESFMAVAEVAKALGLDRRLNRYVKAMFDDEGEDDINEVECLGSKSKTKKCRKMKKKKKRKKKKKSKPKESSEEDEAPSLNFVDSEEYAPYVIKGDKGEEEMADEILAESDPLSFYYVMKDQKRRQMKRQKPVPKQQMQMPQMTKMPQMPPKPLFRIGSLPLFFRFRRPMSNNRQY